MFDQFDPLGTASAPAHANAPIHRSLPTSRLTPEQRQLELQTFAIAFESVLEHLAEGQPFERFCRDYPTPIPSHPLSIARFRTWIFRDEKRRNAYMMAKAMGAEAVEDELVRIADGLDPSGNPSPSEVSRSKLQIDTRRWLLQIWNRKRYGDIKQVEQTVTTTTTVESVKQIPTAVLQNRLLQALGLEEVIDQFGTAADPVNPSDPDAPDSIPDPFA